MRPLGRSSSVVSVMAVPQKHLIIIGGGSSAHAAAIKAASLNARSTVINTGLPQGGTCVNVGCVPSKFLIRSAEKQQHPTFPQLIQQKQKLVEGLREAKVSYQTSQDTACQSTNM